MSRRVVPRLPFVLLSLILAGSAAAQSGGGASQFADWDNVLIYRISEDGTRGSAAPTLDDLTAVVREGSLAERGISAIRLPMLVAKERGGVADYTALDPRWGTVESLKTLVRTAHEQGIRVIMDINVNDTAPPPAGGSVSDSVAIWWDAGWIRADADGFEACGTEPTTACRSGRADFRTEVGSPVLLPAFLTSRWGSAGAAAEQSELDDFFARTRHPRTPRYYIIKWLADWVRDYGIDGFFAVGVDGVDVGLWSSLKQEAVTARNDWAQRSGNALSGSGGFWLGGDADPLGEAATELFTQGFDVMAYAVSSLPTKHAVLDSLYAVQSDSIVASASRGLVAELREAGFAGGGVDATADAAKVEAQRALLLPGALILPPNVTIESLGNDPTLLAIAAFRRRHDAIGAGTHLQIGSAPYIFQRSLMVGARSDDVVIALNAQGRTRINVSSAFPDDALVRDVITGKTGFVSFGYVSFTPDESGLLLLEEVQ